MLLPIVPQGKCGNPALQMEKRRCFQQMTNCFRNGYELLGNRIERECEYLSITGFSLACMQIIKCEIASLRESSRESLRRTLRTRVIMIEKQFKIIKLEERTFARTQFLIDGKLASVEWVDLGEDSGETTTQCSLVSVVLWFPSPQVTFNILWYT